MRYLAGVALAASCLGSPAFAQSMPPGGDLPSPAELANKDTITVGLGAGIVPDYDGSDDYRIIPAGAVRGKVKGISFSTRGTLSLRGRRSRRRRVRHRRGPHCGRPANRRGNIKDDIVDLLPERNMAVELGGFAGISFKGLTNPYDFARLPGGCRARRC